MIRRFGASDLALTAAIGIVVSLWGTHYIRVSRAAGRPIGFYHQLFEPALMLVCGRGFNEAIATPAGVNRFLSQADDGFSCESLPQNLPTRTERPAQGSWLYLMLLVSAWWRVIGFSWNGIAPLFGVAFGLGSAAAYVIFRFGMGRTLALGCTAAFALSSLQLLELNDLRDYAKTPFMFSLIAILFALAFGRFSVRRLLLLSALFGVVVGVGYGFKPDPLIQLPLFAVTVLLFLPVPVRAFAAAKAAALVTAAVAFYVAMWPVFRATPATGNNLWHVAIIGLMPEYGTALGVEHPVYHMGVTGSDEFVELAVASYAKRIHPEWPPMTLSTTGYERGSRAYFMELASRFPADMITRTIASLVRMPELPFGWPQPPVSGLLDRVYAVRERVLTPLYGCGLALLAGALVPITFAVPRHGLFLLAAYSYVSAYPVIEFHNRNFFYLEVIGWLAIGFLAAAAGALLLRRPISWPAAGVVRKRAIVGAAVALIVVASVAAVRALQATGMRRLITSYLRAPVRPLVLEQGDSDGLHSAIAPALTAGSREPSWARLLRVELDAGSCGTGTVTFQYDRTSPFRGLTSSVRLSPEGASAGTRTVVFEPVYSGFSAVTLSGAGAPCLVSMSEVTGLDAEPLWLPLVLHADWSRASLYQTIRTRENIH